MSDDGFLQTAGPLLTVLTPLVAVPLTMITFYLRSLRDQQSERQSALSRRLDSLEALTDELRCRMIEFERGYTTKEEWLRELIAARGRIERITEKTIRLEAAMHPSPRTDEHGTGRHERHGDAADAAPAPPEPRASSHSGTGVPAHSGTGVPARHRSVHPAHRGTTPTPRH